MLGNFFCNHFPNIALYARDHWLSPCLVASVVVRKTAAATWTDPHMVQWFLVSHVLDCCFDHCVLFNVFCPMFIPRLTPFFLEIIMNMLRCEVMLISRSLSCCSAEMMRVQDAVLIFLRE